MTPSLDLVHGKVSKAVEALLALHEKTQKSALLGDVEKIYLSLSLYKIPVLENPLSIVLDLPHGMLAKTYDVCLIVKDVDKGKRDYDPTIEFYKDLLEAHGVTRISQITPLKFIKLENQPYEMKRNFAQMYDVFLADGRIVRFLPRLLGKDFFRSRTFFQVDMTAKNLQKSLMRAMNQTKCIVKGKGCTSMAAVANTEMGSTEMADNIVAAVRDISNKIPGGPRNIHSVHIKTQNSMAIPVFVSSHSPNSVRVRMEEPKTAPFYMKAEDVTPITGRLVKFVTPTSFKLIQRNKPGRQKVKKVARQSVGVVKNAPRSTRGPKSANRAAKSASRSTRAAKSPSRSTRAAKSASQSTRAAKSANRSTRAAKSANRSTRAAKLANQSTRAAKSANRSS